MAKGSTFEREVCALLSRWWTFNARDDVFYRTAGSGGRATARQKKGKRTTNSHGDVCALDSVGEQLLKLVTIELKRGYSRQTIADLLDAPAGATTQTYESWFQQAQASAEGSGAVHWLVIVKRDRREAITILPQEFLELLESLDCPLRLGCLGPVLTISRPGDSGVLACHLDDFLRVVAPDKLRHFLEVDKK